MYIVHWTFLSILCVCIWAIRSKLFVRVARELCAALIVVVILIYILAWIFADLPERAVYRFPVSSISPLVVAVLLGSAPAALRFQVTLSLLLRFQFVVAVMMLELLTKKYVALELARDFPILHLADHIDAISGIAFEGVIGMAWAISLIGSAHYVRAGGLCHKLGLIAAFIFIVISFFFFAPFPLAFLILLIAPYILVQLSCIFGFAQKLARGNPGDTPNCPG